MKSSHQTPFKRFLILAIGTLRPPSGGARITIAMLYGTLCHVIFTLSVLAMVGAMFFGMSESFGRVPMPWSILVNILLIVQFPIMHSFLLTSMGRKFLAKLAPLGHGLTLVTTTYAIIASIQLLALFTLWTPSDIIWWRAEGSAFVLICAMYTLSWLLLMWASFSAGAEVQSGALGWMSLIQKISPVFPDMPTTGLFRVIRQPIYVAFALTTWTVPVWTPDQLILAVVLTTYCLVAPLLKERRFERKYGDRFVAYKRCVPYMIPNLHGAKNHED